MKPNSCTFYKKVCRFSPPFLFTYKVYFILIVIKSQLQSLMPTSFYRLQRMLQRFILLSRLKVANDLAKFIKLFTLIILISVVSTFQYAKVQPNIQTVPIHDFMSDSEKLLLLGTSDKVPSYELIESSKISGLNYYLKKENSKSKRSIMDSNFNPHHWPFKLNITFRAFAQDFKLILEQNSKLLSPEFRYEQQTWSKYSQSNKLFKKSQAECFYQGYSSNSVNSSAALSLCNGLRGIIETETGIFEINPLPNHLIKYSNKADNQSGQQYIVLKKDSHSGYQCPHTKSQVTTIFNTSSTHSRPRLTRSIHEFTDTVTVETAVFIDESLYNSMKKTFPDDNEEQIINYILTIMNAVQLLFKQPSLGVNVEIAVVLLDILKKQPKDLIASDNIDTYLTNFCIWQHNKKSNGRGLKARWDHALLLSGINMYVIDGKGRKKRHVVGLAPVSGMCNSLNSCTISEGTSFQTVLVAGHEMGHSLGMEHDGASDGNSCDQDNFVMSPTLGAGKTSWSSCSKDYLEKFLNLPQASCIASPSSNVNILNQISIDQTKLPGQLFTADQQCVLRFGADSRKSHLQKDEDICRLLRCNTGKSHNIVAYHAHPALEGTTCGTSKWCKGGQCVSKSVIESSESQIVPQTVHQNYIQVDNNSEFVEKVKKDLSLCYTLIQNPKTGEIYKQNLPDGTACGKSSIGLIDHFCIDGFCHRAKCFNFNYTSELCTKPSLSHFLTPINENLKNVKQIWSPWFPVSRCRFPCLTGGRGMKLVTRSCNHQSCQNKFNKQESFQLCSTSESNCPKRILKTTEQYANDLCTSYQKQYPTLLSGKGRQLSPRPENKHVSCIIACQDRVWRDVHYQMDAFEDGKFPLGTDCSLGTNKHFKAYCVNGKCIRFDENGLPFDQDSQGIDQVKMLFKREMQMRSRFRQFRQLASQSLKEVLVNS